MTGFNTTSAEPQSFGVHDAPELANTKAALILAAASIALTGAFVFGQSGQNTLTWLMPAGSVAGLVAAALSLKASSVHRQNWLAAGTVSLLGAAALAVGIFTPAHVLIAASSLAVGLAISLGRPKLQASASEPEDRALAPNWEAAAELLGGEIVECDHRSTVLSAGASGINFGTKLVERVHIADRPAFLLACGAASNLVQNLSLRMQVGGAQHYTATQVCIRNHSGNLLIGLHAGGKHGEARTVDDAARELAHELRTPLAAMVGLADALVEAQTCTEAMRSTYPALISKAGRSLIELTGTILETEMESPAGTQMKLGAVAQDCIALMQQNARQQSITLFNRIPSHLAEKDVESGAMRQILTNLISNAVKFSPTGASVELDAAVSANGWTLSVTDNGHGIAPEDVARLGQQNFRGGKSAGISGYGLGLSIVRRLVDGMNARISFESRPGKGTRVVITFPSTSLVEFSNFHSRVEDLPEAQSGFNKAAGAKHAAA